VNLSHVILDTLTQVHQLPLSVLHVELVVLLVLSTLLYKRLSVLLVNLDINRLAESVFFLVIVHHSLILLLFVPHVMLGSTSIGTFR